MRSVVAAVLVSVLWSLASCTGASGTRCDRICRTEADCAEKLDVPDVDRGGCVEACGELERDPRTAQLVDRHVHCVVNASSCPEILECP